MLSVLWTPCYESESFNCPFNLDKCNDLSEHYNGSVTIATDGDTTTATFACDSGYTMAGSPVIQCSEDGTWEIEQPSCSKCYILLVIFSTCWILLWIFR